MKYAVDWSDKSYPCVVEHRGNPWVDALTFTQAKQEIIDYHYNMLVHARDQIAVMRALRVKDVDKG